MPLPKAPEGPDPEKDEDYWSLIREFYPRPEGFIQLENGYFSSQPLTTLRYHQEREADINRRSSWYMRREQSDAIENARKSLAGFLGCPAEELALTRNTTEALNILIMGFPWKKGDEAVIGDQDYGSMTEAFRQVEKRYGVRIRVATVPLHPANDEEVIQAYLKHITRKTRLLHLTHLINLTGQVIPVAAIARTAKQKFPSLLVASDSAHAVAHLDFNIPGLEVDFAAASLHKWLCNPLGAGFLWMKEKHIPLIWPLMGDTGVSIKDIRRFEHQGTRPIQTLETISEAIRFHHRIGGPLKEKRLRYLMQYWVSKVADLPKVQMLTPWKDERRCGAIANIAVAGYSPDQLSSLLLDKYRIFTVAINHPVVNGVRITPGLANSTQDLDKLIAALTEISAG